MRSCRGPIPTGHGGRRAFLQAGLAGFSTLSLPGILKLKNQSTAQAAGALNPSTDKKSGNHGLATRWYVSS